MKPIHTILIAVAALIGGGIGGYLLGGHAPVQARRLATLETTDSHRSVKAWAARPACTTLLILATTLLAMRGSTLPCYPNSGTSSAFAAIQLP